LRSGEGQQAAEILKGLVTFHSGLDEKFDGTTIMGRNDEVDRYNRARLMELPGKWITLRSRQWGNPDTGAWKNIPAEFSLREGALVMLRSNSGADLTYANGDNGHVKEFDGKTFHVELVRNGEVVRIGPIHRTKISRDTPSDSSEEDWERFDSSLGERPPYGRVSFDEGLNIWHVGGIQYFPLVAAYATTVHRSQGLSLDRVQVDIRNNFLGSPGMEYVAVSRCRSPEGIRIVGTPDLLARRCSTDPEVRPYI
jgi:ATP-dependent exoDNAse (exonuclease V) alpha subunit